MFKGIEFYNLTRLEDFLNLKEYDKVLVKTFEGTIRLITVSRVIEDKENRNVVVIPFEDVNTLHGGHLIQGIGVYRQAYLVK